MALRHIDIDTPQPNGRFGEPTRSANIKHNANIIETEERLEALESGTAGTGTRLDGEIAARAAADAALSGRIDDGHALITQETADRIAAVQAEATARADAQTALARRIHGKNRLINGDFRFWQRGDTFTSTRYSADRWRFSVSGVATPAITRTAIAPGTIDTEARNLASITYGAISDAANHYVGLEQPIEDVRTLAGRKVTISAWVYNAGAAGRQICFELLQVFGTGGSAPVTGIGPKRISLPAGLSKVTHTVDIPSIAGKSIGTTSALTLTMWLSAGTFFNSRTDSLGPQVGGVQFTDVQFEVGEVATEYERRHPAIELALCQRYYQKSYNVETTPGSVTNEGRVVWGTGGVSNAINRAYTPFKVAMRGAPSVGLYGAPSGANSVVSQADGSNVVASPEAIGESGFNVAWTNTNGQWGGWWHWAADAEI